MKTIKIIFFIALYFVCSTMYSQRGKVRQADKEYKNLAYIKTSEILLEVAKGGYKSVDLFQKLGNSFYFNNKNEDAAKWYGELMAMDAIIDPEYYFRYAQSLKSIENYTESDKWMQKFADSKSDDLRGKSFSSTVDYLVKIEAVSRDFEVYNMDLNTEFSDFGTVQYKDQFVFASTRDSEGKIYKWNEQPYLELYKATKEDDGGYSKVVKFDNKINTKYHESTASFTSDDKVMYFTRNNYFNKRLKKDKEGVNRLQLYKAQLQEDGSWGDVISVQFNSKNYSVAHPSINIYDKKLYFASDMPGTYGNSDLYVVSINSDGTLGIPTNLGASVNTEGSETFPYVNSKGDLFFSSNGFSGLGGLDVYMIKDFEKKYESHELLIVENLGRPINSSKDDFGYYENLGTKEGFFSSNRLGGKGDDDIYSFTIPECKQVVTGVVKEKDTQALLPNAIVTLFDGAGKKLQELNVDDNAAFKFELDCEKEYLIRAGMERYVSEEKRFTTPERKQELTLDMELEKNEKEIRPDIDIANVLDISIIYFDLDKSYIRPDAEIQLQKIIAVLKKYPKMTIDVRSHTDSRATFAYNDALSNRRNKATIKYIVEVGGIDVNRVTGRGYGERNLINKCVDGVPCSDAEHEENRRSEFIVVSM